MVVNSRAMLLRKMAARWQLYIFILIPLIYIIIFCYVPMVGLQLAFKEYDFHGTIASSPWVGFLNLERFLDSYQFMRVLRNTLSVSVYSLLAGFPLPILFALLLNALPLKRYCKVVQTITYMPHFISTVVMVGILMQVFDVRVGVFAAIYRALVGPNPPNLFADASAFPHLYVWSGVWQSLGWGSIIYLAALSGIDSALEEAAQIDGANRLQRLWHIDLTHILPTVCITLILRMGSIMGVGFEKVYLMQNDLNVETSEVISTYVYKIGLVSGGGDFSYGTAVGMFNSLVNFVLVISVNKITAMLGGASLW